MKSTSAVDVIIHALCPGPDEESAFGAPFVTYASRSATRVARSGAAADAAGATVCASAIAGTSMRHAVRHGASLDARPRRPMFVGFMGVCSLARDHLAKPGCPPVRPDVVFRTRFVFMSKSLCEAPRPPSRTTKRIAPWPAAAAG